uniref:Protein IWS1 homolog (Trinotate prediction) n=1 Tax=Myxobolus squamalis TaxID=59785 RepID=A0A6B2G5B2_MYXSQ
MKKKNSFAFLFQYFCKLYMDVTALDLICMNPLLRIRFIKPWRYSSYFIQEWLNILPDGSLPNIKIRSALISILQSWPVPSPSILKSSQLGRCLMILSKHSKETPQNRLITSQIIFHWVRPIYGVSTSFQSFTREDRELEDLKHFKQPAKDEVQKKIVVESEQNKSKPGDKKFIMRARVPHQNNTDYVIRPRKAILNSTVNPGIKKNLSQMKQTKKFQQKIRNKKN